MAQRDDDVDHGKALTRFLEQEWRALGTNRGRWCRENGLSDSTVLRWGQEPSTQIDISLMQTVARGLGRPLVDILVAARYLTPEEVGGRQVTARLPIPVAEAIRTDPELTDELRDALLGMLRAWASVATGQREATAGPRRRSTRAPTRRR